MHLSQVSDRKPFDPNIVTNDDLAVLANCAPDSITGYYGVFKHRDRFRAIAFHLRIGESHPNPRAAAMELVRFWKYWFGPSWAKCFRSKKGHAWTFVPEPNGFRVMVYLLGRPFFLGPKRIKRRTVWVPVPGRGHVFPTRGEGWQAYRRFVWWRYGMFAALAGLEIRRDGPAPKRKKYRRR